MTLCFRPCQDVAVPTLNFDTSRDSAEVVSHNNELRCNVASSMERRKEGVNIRILLVYLEAVAPHKSTFEPHFEVYHYLEWIRSVKIT